MSEIIHVDLDGFFVAVERQLDPRLAARPVVIGGQPSTHGVVVAACAEAARRGVRPGLSLAIAAARCPDAAFLDGAVERYLEASAAVDEILRDPHTTGAGAAVEWTAIDSVFVEVGAPVSASAGASGSVGPASGDGLRVAERIRERLQRELGFEVSCGIATTRAAAQIASRISRPRGVLYALPGYEARLLAPLDIGLLPDLPAGARQRLVMERIMTLGDLAGVSDERAKALLGARGPSFVRWARGEDDRPIDRSQPPRSIAREVTLTHADAPEAELAEVVRHLADVLAMRLRSMGWFARTVTLRLRRVSAGSASAAGETSDTRSAVGGSSASAAESAGPERDAARGDGAGRGSPRRRGVAAEGAVAAAARRRPGPRALQPAADGSADAAVPARCTRTRREPPPTRCGCGRAFACWSISATSPAVSLPGYGCRSGRGQAGRAQRRTRGRASRRTSAAAATSQDWIGRRARATDGSR